jgi:hypothetical protein
MEVDWLNKKSRRSCVEERFDCSHGGHDRSTLIAARTGVSRTAGIWFRRAFCCSSCFNQAAKTVQDSR